MTNKKLIILILVFFIPFFLTYFFLSIKEKTKGKGSIFSSFINQEKKIIANKDKEKVSPTVKITGSTTPQPTLSISQNAGQQDMTERESLTITLTPTTFPRLDVNEDNIPTPTQLVERVRGYLILPTKAPTPTPTITISRLNVTTTTYTATITFNTSRPCSSQILYGEASVGGNLPRSEVTTSHSKTINLEEGTTYFYQIKLFPSKYSGELLYESPVGRFTTKNAKRVKLVLETIEIIKDGNSSGPGSFRFYLGVRDPAHSDLVTCCGFLERFSASDGQKVNINKTFLGGGAQHGTPLTVYMDEDQLADPGMLHFSFEAPLSGPNQQYTKSVTSSEKNGKKFKANFRIEIFDN
ncbi:MAG: hypothetical protein QHH09_01270 [Microgenomates group bacterium]|nr:hypothetical protein [Microgenomates group bacterium]